MADEKSEVRLRPDGAVILERKLDRTVEEVRQRLVNVEEERVNMFTGRGERGDPQYQKWEIWQPEKRTVWVYKVVCYAASKKTTSLIKVLLAIAIWGVALALVGVALVVVGWQDARTILTTAGTVLAAAGFGFTRFVAIGDRWEHYEQGHPIAQEDFEERVAEPWRPDGESRRRQVDGPRPPTQE